MAVLSNGMSAQTLTGDVGQSQYSSYSESRSPTNSIHSHTPQVNGDTIQKARTVEEVLSLETVREALQACKIVKSRMHISRTTAIRKCPVTHQATDQEDFEHDFTTPGVQGNLQCPFATMAQTTDPRNGETDPIAAEFHAEQTSIPSPTQPGKCPIRFLDQHSPEEVAKYFENHKHEIPRSHEVCVKRYQQNEQSIRQLDARYGNLVSMIQGLGTKHKQYLPTDQRSEGDHDGPRSVEAVQKWADTVSDKAVPDLAVPDPDVELEPVEEQHANDKEERKPHFERPLREIRVGESPSRPWGISVPAGQKASQSAMLSDRGTEPVSLACSEVSAKPVKTPVPVAEGVVPNGLHKVDIRDLKEDKDVHNQPSSLPKAGGQHQIVFNGPVFFGYSAEQAAVMLQNFDFSRAGHHR